VFQFSKKYFADFIMINIMGSDNSNIIALKLRINNSITNKLTKNSILKLKKEQRRYCKNNIEIGVETAPFRIKF